VARIVEIPAMQQEVAARLAEIMAPHLARNGFADSLATKAATEA
jgi:hypothetical protein